MSKKWYFKIVLFFCLLNFVLRLPFVEIPMRVDEYSYVNHVELIVKNKFNLFVEDDWYKAPLMFFLPSLFSTFFESSLFFSRIEIYFFSSLLLFFVYLIAKDFFKNEKAGVWSVIILSFYPLFFTQSFLFQDPIPTALFFTMSFYFLYTNKYKYYILSSIALVMTREVGLLAIFIFAITDLFLNKKSLFHAIKLHVPALIIFIIWMLLNKHFLGWYLWPGNTNLIDFKEIFSIDFYYFLKNFFINQLIFVFLIFGFLQNVVYRKKLLLIFFSLLIINLITTYPIGRIYRYNLFVIPLFIVFFVDAILVTVKNKNIFLCLFFLTMNIFHIINYINSPSAFDSQDYDLRFIKTVKYDENTFESVKKYCKKCIVVSDNPYFVKYINFYHSEITAVEITMNEDDQNKLFFTSGSDDIIYILYLDASREKIDKYKEIVFIDKLSWFTRTKSVEWFVSIFLRKIDSTILKQTVTKI